MSSLTIYIAVNIPNSSNRIPLLMLALAVVVTVAINAKKFFLTLIYSLIYECTIFYIFLSHCPFFFIQYCLASSQVTQRTKWLEINIINKLPMQRLAKN